MANRPFWLLIAVACVISACSAGDNPRAEERSQQEITLEGFSVETVWLNQQLAEDVTARCMRAAGFDYTPRNLIDHIARDAPSRFNAEYASERGFGIVYGLLNPASNVVDDPNEAVFQLLGSAEQQAWMASLYGSPLIFDENDRTLDPVTGEVVFDGYGASDGCLRQGQDEAAARQPALLALDHDRQELLDDYEADPRIVVARQQWEQCILNAGFGAASVAALHSQLDSELGSLRWKVADAMSLIPIDAEPGTARVEDFLDRETLDALDAFRRWEVIAATAAVACNDQTGNVFRDVLAEYDAEFAVRAESALLEYRQPD